MAYDIVIKNGTVVDGTGREPYHADVAVEAAFEDHVVADVRVAVPPQEPAAHWQAGARTGRFCQSGQKASRRRFAAGLGRIDINCD